MRCPLRHWIWLLLAFPLAAPAQETEPSLRTSVNEVMLDVVVRDKKARIIRDLRPEEVKVFEDGVPQTLRHFEFFEGHQMSKPAPQPAPATAANACAPPVRSSSPPNNVQELRDISVVSVVVANLDQQGRKLTLDTMHDFVKNELRPNTYVGVFWLYRNTIRAVEPYTNDAGKISDAMMRAVTGVGIEGRPTLKGLRPDAVTGWDGDSAEGTPPDPLGLDGSDQPVNSPADAVARAIANTMSSQWIGELHDVYQDSMGFLTQLHALVQSQASIPGRKVVLLFSAGLAVHPDTVEVFRSVISSANRANVSVYAIDTISYGRSDLSNSRRMLAAAAQASRAQQLGQVNGGDQSVTPIEAMAPQLAEASVHANTRGNLATLAEGTGGALLSTSMDLPKALARVLEEVQTHYELSYSPLNSNADGKFRNVEVKVSRPGAVVFARSGYFALPLLNDRQVYPFEMVTLKALNTKPLPRQFDFHAAALQFRPGQKRTQYSFVFEVPTTDLTVTEEKLWARLHVDVTVLVKDERGQVVQKISRDIPYQVPMNKKDELQRGVVSFTAPFLLAPGRYTLETAVVDRQSMKASVHRSTLVAGHGSGLSMSDVALVRRVDAIEGPANGADPLQAKGGKVTPELSGSVSPQSGAQVQFYAAAYPPMPVDAPVEVRMEIARDGQTLVRSPLSEVPAETTGVVPVLVGVPSDKLPPGHYEAQLTFTYKGQNVSNVTAFTVDAQN